LIISDTGNLAYPAARSHARQQNHTGWLASIEAPTQISFSSTTSQIAGVMADFVSAVNEITAELSASANPLGGRIGK